MSLEITPCNLCGHSDARPVLRSTDTRLRTPGTFTIVRCTRCALAFVNPRPDALSIGEHYPPDYEEHTPLHFHNLFAETQAQIVSSHRNSPGSLLDVGCASGAFLAAMQQLGWSVAGTDTSEQAVELAKSLPSADIRTGSLAEVAFLPNSYDIVTLWSVFEHLHDPLGTLRLIRELLRPDGLLFLVVPNFRSFERIVFRRHWFALELPRHLYHFTPKTMERMLSAGSFDVATLQQASGHDTLRSSIKMLSGRLRAAKPQGDPPPVEDYQPRPPDSRERQLKRAINGRVVNVLTTTADRLGVGSQLFIVARPRL